MRLAVLGCGAIAQWHVDAAASVADAASCAAAAVDEGQPLAAPAEDALRDLAVIEAAYRSLQGSGWERVEPVDGPTALAVT